MVLIGIALWLIPLRSDYWLDETGTIFVIKDGLAKTIDRAFTFQGQSPLYYLIALAASRVGSSEAIVRVPSVLSMVAATWMLYKIGIRLRDQTTALVACALFVVAGTVSFAAADARPYALTLSLLCASALSMVRWVQEGKTRDLVLAVIAAALTVYGHYLFAIALAGHAWYLVSAARAGRIKAKPVVVAATAVAVLCAPLAPPLMRLFAGRESLGYLPRPSPAVLALALIVVAIRYLLRTRGKMSGDPNALALLVPWTLVPPVAIYLASIVGGAGFFHPKYYLSAAPALVLLVAEIVRSFKVEWGPVVVGVGLIASALVTVRTQHSQEGWRQAIAAVNRVAEDSTPVLVHSGFIEARQPSWLQDGKRRGFLLAPIAAYPMKGVATPLPFDLSNGGTGVLGSIADGLTGTRFVMITNYIDPFTAFFHGRGFGSRIVGVFGTVLVVEFDRG